MITTDFTGNFGNHLWQYVVLRSTAIKKGFDWGFTNYIYGDYFGGRPQMDFLDLDYGKPVCGIVKEYREPTVSIHLNGEHHNLPLVDNFENLEDNSKLVGCWQSEFYFKGLKEEVKDWLRIKREITLPINLDDKTCIINVRGGEYRGIGQLLISPKYWYDSINHMKLLEPKMNFIVVSDDIPYVKSLFPNFECYHFSIAIDYCLINRAKWLILSNSSFGWFPAWLNEDSHLTIAPKYWSRHNVSDGYWSPGSIYTSKWKWMSREGILQTYDEVINELINSKYSQYYTVG